MINYIPSIIRFFVLILLQGIILHNIENTTNIHFIVYPLFILLLPFETPHWLVLLVAFVNGILIDIFYDSLGVNAFTSVLIGFLRPYICLLYEPRGGYSADQAPTMHSSGRDWFFRYTGLAMLLHITTYFILDRFGFDLTVLWKILSNYFLSMLVIIASQYIFNPKR